MLTTWKASTILETASASLHNKWKTGIIYKIIYKIFHERFSRVLLLIFKIILQIYTIHEYKETAYSFLSSLLLARYRALT